MITKEEIKKEEFNELLMELIKLVPKETIDTVSDFIRVSLILGWKKSRFLFIEYVWKYISLVVFKESLRDYYGKSIDFHLQEKIDEIKTECNRIIEKLVSNHLDAKHSQDKLYQRWVKKKR